MTLTRAQLEAAAAHHDADVLHTRVHSPLFGTLPADIFLEPSLSTVSDRQLRALQGFATLAAGMTHVAEQLFAAWDNHSDHFELQLDDAAEALRRAEVRSVLVNTEQYWGEVPAVMVRFRPEWDPEHGIGVFVIDGELGQWGDGFDRPR